ncbi:hypothetical protein P3L10_031147 [Capsicum annuum]
MSNLSNADTCCALNQLICYVAWMSIGSSNNEISHAHVVIWRGYFFSDEMFVLARLELLLLAEQPFL